ncbi:hypothetical protein BCR42DRAFT_444265 [Absidia repens]|uniref:Uncharacterized protein n=1 Tax=Absidia repens TaxID=90262 RepID=A0A1X2HX70_9FUNG|nr:hypothetical protein BCR42DRAFT_444265 [Absidia repens]
MVKPLLHWSSPSSTGQALPPLVKSPTGQTPPRLVKSFLPPSLPKHQLSLGRLDYIRRAIPGEPSQSKHFGIAFVGCKLFYLSQVKPIQVKSNQAKSNQVKSYRAKSNQAKSNQAKSNQAKSNQVRSNQIKTDQINSNQIKPNEAYSCQSSQIKSIQAYLPKLPYDFLGTLGLVDL